MRISLKVTRHDKGIAQKKPPAQLAGGFYATLPVLISG
jgi:hypothetical protein